MHLVKIERTKSFIRKLVPHPRHTRYLKAPNPLYPGIADDWLAVDIGAKAKRGSLVLVAKRRTLSTQHYDPKRIKPRCILGVVLFVAIRMV